MKQVKINRQEWMRGGLHREKIATCLWSKEANAGCCLGHVCIQLYDAEKSELDDIAEPDYFFKSESIMTVYSKEIEQVCNTSFTEQAVGFNDSDNIDDDAREAELIELFSKNGIELSFYN